MGCGCNKATGAATKFEVAHPDGSKTEVRSEAAALIAARKSGGTYKKITI